MELRRHLLLGLGGYVLELRSILRWKTLLGDGDKLERLAVENGNRSGGRRMTWARPEPVTFRPRRSPFDVESMGGLKAPAYSRTPSSAPWATASLASPI